MGIRTDPGYRLYTNDNFCFPTGKAPKKLYATISGVVFASWMPPGLEAWFNGNFLLETDGGGGWNWYSNEKIVSFTLQYPTTLFYAGVLGVGFGFYFDSPLPCKFSGPNDYQNESHGTYGGNFSVTPRD